MSSKYELFHSATTCRPVPAHRDLSLDFPPTRAVMAGKQETEKGHERDSVLAQLAALPEKSTSELKQLWRDLYDREPPPYNKPFLVKRLAVSGPGWPTAVSRRASRRS